MTTFVGKSRGIYQIAEPTAVEDAEQSFDFIALHGLGGAWNKTWTSRSGFCWLSKALASRFPTSRILSVDRPSILQDLASNPVDVSGLIADLIHERSSRKRSDHPVIFIGHSFGGNFLKKIYLSTHPLWTQEPDHHQLHRLIRAFIYYGTHHKQVSFPDISALWRTLEFTSDSMLRGKSQDLSYAISNVSRINDDFCEFDGESLPSLCFYETVKTGVGLHERYIVSRLDATLGSRPVETTPLDSKHQALGKIQSANDNNLFRIIAALDRLMTIVKDPGLRYARVAESRAKRRGLNLLSLDGGGVKGYFTILVLERLLDVVAELEGTEEQIPVPKRPCDYFDLIGGTSTGGLLAIMLGRLQMDIKACIHAYKTLSSDVFYRFNKIPIVQSIVLAIKAVSGTSWYSGESLKAAVCNTINENTSPLERDNMLALGFTAEDLRLAPAPAPNKGRCFVCAVPKGQHIAHRLRSYPSINDDARDTNAYTIWEAARATSAAPLYFPPLDVRGQIYYDGALHCNNPVIEVIKEARTEFPVSCIKTLVSIGTGSTKITEPLGLFGSLYSFIERVTDTEARHQDVLNDDSFKDVRPGYFRFQEHTKLGEIDLADAGKLNEIERLAQQFLGSDTAKRHIKACAERMISQYT